MASRSFAVLNSCAYLMPRRPVCTAIRLTNGLVICGAKYFDPLMMRTVLAAGMDGTELVGCERGFVDRDGDFMTEEDARIAKDIRRARHRSRMQLKNSTPDLDCGDVSTVGQTPASIKTNQETKPMAFKPFVKKKYAPRQWGLVGFAGTGKSTFLAQLRQPLLVIDADGRFNEVADRCRDPVTLDGNPNDNRDGLAIAKALHGEDLSGIGTVVLDSLTPILRLTIAMAMESNKRGENKNKAAAFMDKANQLRLIQDSLVRPGVDSVIVWHYEHGLDENGKDKKNQTLPREEGRRLMRSMNVIIALNKDDKTGERSAEVVWSRVGKKGIVIPDTKGYWEGVPERIEAALYDVPAQGSVTPLREAS